MFTRKADALPRKKRALRGRRLVVVDIENMVGGAVLATEQAAAARRSLQEAVNLSGCEQVIIGTSHIGALASGLGWCRSRLVVRSGENGADLGLLDVLTGERIPERFDEVVLASGDGIFTDVVAALGAAGVAVTVVARSGHCSRRLRMAAGRTVFLTQHAVAVGGAA
jgi:hypothetical protein